MKNFRLLLAFVLLLTVVSCQQQNSTTEKSPSETTETTFVTFKMDVKGMTCTGCENTVKKSVEKVEGVSVVTASHTDSVATVTFDASKTTINEITQAITQKGYTVEASEQVKAE